MLARRLDSSSKLSNIVNLYSKISFKQKKKASWKIASKSHIFLGVQQESAVQMRALFEKGGDMPRHIFVILKITRNNVSLTTEPANIFLCKLKLGSKEKNPMSHTKYSMHINDIIHYMNIWFRIKNYLDFPLTSLHELHISNNLCTVCTNLQKSHKPALDWHRCNN